MSRPDFSVKESYLGDGSVASYSFNFKITQDSQLLVIVLDDEGAEVERVRGDDTSFLSGVTLDAVDGGGTVDLVDPLPLDYTILLIQADFEPVQDYEFRNKTSFSLRRFEDAIDRIAGAIQYAAYTLKQCLKIHEADDESAFDTRLPPGIADMGDRILKINADGTGFEFGPDVNEIAGATPGFVDFNGPISGSLARNEIGILRAGVSFALTLDDTDLEEGDLIELKCLGFAGVLTVAPASGQIDGAATFVTIISANAAFRFRYTGSEFIVT